MQSSLRHLWVSGLVVTLLVGLPGSSAEARGRFGDDRPSAQKSDAEPRPRGHGWSGHRGRWGWGHGWSWGHAWGWKSAHERWCAVLRAELSSETSELRWGWGRLWLLWFGCGPLEAPEPEPDPDPLADPPEHTLQDAAGAAMADLGRVEVDHETIRVPYGTDFVDPVVIVGPPTNREADPGVVQVLDVDGEGFRVRLREWDYLDGDHLAESVSYLVLEAGRHQLSDGSEWEAGVLDLSDTGAWGAVSFGSPFASAPLVFLTVQSSNEDEPLLVRAREVTSDGFQAALFEEEGADGLRGQERVGYLAVHSPRGSGRLDGTARMLPYLMRSVVADHRRVPVLSSSLWLEEETSVDDEMDHADETLAFLAIGQDVFAQATTDNDLDPAAVRRAAPEYGPVLEWGTLAGVDGAWHTVPLARTYSDPVVVVGPMSSNDAAPALLRVRNVGVDAFELRAESWAYVGRDHGPERAFYMVVDPGIQSLGGLVVEAGHLDSSQLLQEGQETVTLPMPYTDVPGVFASVMTTNGTQPVMARVVGRTSDDFRVALQPEEAYDGGLPAERIGWVSIQRGSGVTSDGRAVNVFDTGVDHTLVWVPFGDELPGRFPSLVAQVSSAFGFDPVVLRYFELAPDGVSLQLEEERSANPETSHRIEDVSVFVAE